MHKSLKWTVTGDKEHLPLKIQKSTPAVIEFITFIKIYLRAKSKPQKESQGKDLLTKQITIYHPLMVFVQSELPPTHNCWNSDLQPARNTQVQRLQSPHQHNSSKWLNREHKQSFNVTTRRKMTETAGAVCLCWWVCVCVPVCFLD